MGTATWDRFSGDDCRIEHSMVHFEKPEPYFILHRELSATPDQAEELSHALADHLSFNREVPKFLLDWEGEGDRLGLAALAAAIGESGFTGNAAWRFSVTPVYGTALTGRYHFEIRLILNLADILSDLPSQAEREAVVARLGTIGSGNAAFFEALNYLFGELADDPRYPGAVAVLREVVGPPSGAAAS